VAFVFDSAAGVGRLYLNGNLIKSGLMTNSVDNTSRTRIGRSVHGGGSFIGKIDDVRIYDRALSGAEVVALYSRESTTPSRLATATAQVVNGFLVGASITDGGFGYTNSPLVTISGGGGAGAAATAVMENGAVSAITIINTGSGYLSTPTITIAPPPYPARKASAASEVVNGFVVGIRIVDGGNGYSAAPAVLLIGGGGSGAEAVATVVDGVVVAVNITSSGTGYTSAPRVSIASPPFSPRISIDVSRIRVGLSLVLGLRYQLESSRDLASWTIAGIPFAAREEYVVQEFDADVTGRYFRIQQIP
jgi:hypothetical protein